MIRQIPPLAHLINELAKLPGIGEKTALRLAYFIINEMSEQNAHHLASAIIEAKEKIILCKHCFNLSDQNPCRICESLERNASLVCVVEVPADVWAIESTGEFNGIYHVLHGTLSPLKGRGPQDLKIPELLDRISSGAIKEIILATNLDVEGNTTALYLSQVLKGYPVLITRIAQGVPAGSELIYTDRLTLGAALEGRKSLKQS